MKNGRASVFSIFAMLIYIAAICFLSVFSIMESKTCTRAAAGEFGALSNEILKAGKSPAKAGASRFDSAKSFIDSSKLIEAVIVERNGAVFFAYPLRSRCIQKNSQDRTVIRPIPVLQKPFSRRISIQSQDDTKIIASMRILRSEKILPVLKFCLAIIVAATILMFFIGFSCEDSENPAENDENIASEAGKQEKSAEIAPKIAEETPKFDENLVGLRAKGEQGIKVEINNNSHNAAPYAPAQEDSAASAGLFEQILPPESAATRFSRQTGLSWKSRLEKRLGEELSLAAKTEQDLSVASIRCKNLKRSSVAAQKIGRLLVERFGDPEFVFEKDDDSFFAIFRDSVIDKAIAVCEDIFADVEAALKSEGEAAQTAIGISSRAHRLVPAGRLIREADAALGRAEAESRYPIVAFRANDRKYRQYLDESYSLKSV